MGAKRILAVENNDLVLSFLQAGLATAGYDVDIASNGREALEKLEHDVYDLIISDMRMPELDGPGLWRALEARRSDALDRLLFLSTPGSIEHHWTFLDETRVPILAKPVDFEDLRSTVERMIGSKDRH